MANAEMHETTFVSKKLQEQEEQVGPTPESNSIFKCTLVLHQKKIVKI